MFVCVALILTYTLRPIYQAHCGATPASRHEHIPKNVCGAPTLKPIRDRFAFGELQLARRPPSLPLRTTPVARTRRGVHTQQME